MGAFKSKATVKIEAVAGWDTGEFIAIKGVVTAEDMEEMSQQSTSAGADGKQQQKSTVSMVAALQRMIEDWCLFGDNDQPVALYETFKGRRHKRLDVIAKLPMAYMLPVMQAIGEIIESAQVPDSENFSSGVNGHMPENLSVVK